MVGASVNKDQLDSAMGSNTLQLKRQFDDAVAINDYLVRTPNEDLLAMGYIQSEIDTMKSAYADLAYGKTNSFDSSPHVKKLYGMGL